MSYFTLLYKQSTFASINCFSYYCCKRLLLSRSNSFCYKCSFYCYIYYYICWAFAYSFKCCEMIVLWRFSNVISFYDCYCSCLSNGGNCFCMFIWWYFEIYVRITFYYILFICCWNMAKSSISHVFSITFYELLLLSLLYGLNSPICFGV